MVKFLNSHAHGGTHSDDPGAVHLEAGLKGKRRPQVRPEVVSVTECNDQGLSGDGVQKVLHEGKHIVIHAASGIKHEDDSVAGSNPAGIGFGIGLQWGHVHEAGLGTPCAVDTRDGKARGSALFADR